MARRKKGTNPYSREHCFCIECDGKTFKRDDMPEHYYKSHGYGKVFKVPCPTCANWLRNVGELAEHAALGHTGYVSNVHVRDLFNIAEGE